MDLFGDDFVDWDAEVDPFPPQPTLWTTGTEEDTELVSLFNDSSTIESKPSFEEEGASKKKGKQKKKLQKRKHLSETEEERKARLAETCRRFRDRRKAEVKSLKRRNEELEAQRELYLQEIAELQLQTQMCRKNELVDLEKENKLLRVEIRKHKRFIQTLLAAAQNIPSVTPEEKYRLLMNGMSAAHGQAMGLAFTSCIDKTWVRCKPFKLHNFNVFFRYQYLPLGSTFEQAKRISIRTDIPCVRESAQDLANKSWAWISSTSTWESIAEAVISSSDMAQDEQQLKSFHVEEFFPELHLGGAFVSEKEDIRVFRYEETFEGQAPRDSIVSASMQDCEIAKSAFPDDLILTDGTNVREALMQDGQLQCKAVVSASCARSSEPLVPSQDGVERLDGPMLDATFVVRLKNGLCHMCTLQSFPIIDQKSLLGGMSSHHGPIALDNGEVSPVVVEVWSVVLRDLKSEHDSTSEDATD